jgi:hypothetical protein
VQFEAESYEPRFQLDQRLLGIAPTLESDHEVIGEAHDDHVATRPLLNRPGNPGDRIS